jgi:multiple sugar transport system permease protein
MASVSEVQAGLEAGRPKLSRQSLLRSLRGGLQGSEYTWALAFLVPYVAVFLAFVVYPIAYGFWMGSEPSLYPQVFSDPIYQKTVVNTLVFLVVDVNLEVFLAFVLSGFFMRRGWWAKAVLLVWVLPWAIPELPAYISVHWMLNGDYGLIDNALWTFFHINGPYWLDARWIALSSVIVTHLWKWVPFWTVIFLAGRMAIPKEILEAAEVDGCTGLRRFVHITVPMLANLYLIATLLLTIFLMGDFNTVNFITGGGPGMSTNVLATLGINQYTLAMADPRLGVAALLTALPLLIPLIIILMRKLRTAQVQL